MVILVSVLSIKPQRGILPARLALSGQAMIVRITSCEGRDFGGEISLHMGDKLFDAV